MSFWRVVSRQKFVESTSPWERRKVLQHQISQNSRNFFGGRNVGLRLDTLNACTYKICSSSGPSTRCQETSSLLAEQIFCFEKSTWSAAWVGCANTPRVSPTSFLKIFAADDAVFCHRSHGKTSLVLCFLKIIKSLPKNIQQSRRVCEGNERNMKFHFRWSMIFVCCIKKKLTNHHERSK